MAKFEIRGLDDMMQALNALEVEEVAAKMLEESVPILEQEVKKEVSRHKDTGDMYESIGSTGARRNQRGYYICVRPTGYASAKKWRNARTKGGKRAGKKVRVRNMGKMVYLEYGTSKQRATPVLSRATRRAEKDVISKMQEVFNREVDGK